MVLSSTVLLLGLGAAVGALVSLAARHEHGETARRVAQIAALLPGVDCGGCGYRLCQDFAGAVARGEADPRGCAPGGPKTAHHIAEIVGSTVAEARETFLAVVHCIGGREQAADRCVYDGIADCHAAVLCGNGARVCVDGCLGLGTCVRACRFAAIAVGPNGIVSVNPDRCTGCGACVKVCPRNVIEIIPRIHKVFLGCNNHDRGTQVTGYCSVGCTACGVCAKVTSSGAITLVNNLPRLDYAVHENFLTAEYKCPAKCFVDLAPARPKVNIDTKCDGCGACVPVCPAGAIAGERGQRHIVDKDKCFGCGICIGVCHTHAIGLLGGLGFGPDVKSGWQRRFR